jgi:acetylornithine aminotransferase
MPFLSIVLAYFFATGSIAAVVAEPGIVTGTGCVRIAPTGFLRALRELTRRHGALLVFDEVGTGFSRCGWLFGMLQEDVVPDIVTLGKGITNGVIPLGAMVTTPEIAETTSDLTELTSTFGWTPAACGVAMECVRIHRRERVWEKAAADGQRLLSRLRAELSGQLAVAWIRGLGMEIGIGFHDARSDSDLSVARRIVGRSLERGLHVVGDGANSLQLMPPLTISAESLERGTGILLDVIREVA